MKMLPRVLDEDVFGLPDDFRFRHDANALGGLRGDEPADFFRHARVRDIEDAQAGVEVGEVNQVALFLDIGRDDSTA
jgi:hypothetical protein